MAKNLRASAFICGSSSLPGTPDPKPYTLFLLLCQTGDERFYRQASVLVVVAEFVDVSIGVQDGRMVAAAKVALDCPPCPARRGSEAHTTCVPSTTT